MQQGVFEYDERDGVVHEAFLFRFGNLLHRVCDAADEEDGGFNPVAFFTIAISVLCTFIGVYVPALSVLYNGAWFVATAVSILLYYFLMKKLDPDFAKAKESLEIDMDRFEIV